jgi:hypothetical protein
VDAVGSHCCIQGAVDARQVGAPPLHHLLWVAG